MAFGGVLLGSPPGEGLDTVVWFSHSALLLLFRGCVALHLRHLCIRRFTRTLSPLLRNTAADLKTLALKGAFLYASLSRFTMHEVGLGLLNVGSVSLKVLF